ncbi:MAG: DegT/DnrJ/EryC1/StrS family aminotransferase, partial [Pseudomonadota bacterium]
MIPLAIPNISGNEGQYLQDCVTSTFVSTVGPFVSQFESMVAQHSGTPGAVATSAGTTGLHAGLVALGVGRDDLVIAPSLTFIASCNAISHAGATPWLMDVDEDSWCLDPALVHQALERDTDRQAGQVVHRATGRRVAAIMPVFTMGTPADMDPLLAIATDAGLPVICDAAAAL